MADLDRVVAGLTCRDVLFDLSEFVDGALPAARVAQIRAHVLECRVCERFGGEFAGVIEAVRRELTAAPPVAPDVAGRLRDRLRKELAG